MFGGTVRSTIPALVFRPRGVARPVEGTHLRSGLTLNPLAILSAPLTTRRITVGSHQRDCNRRRVGLGGARSEMRTDQDSPIPPQISATRKPSGNGSVGSSTYWAIPVIQACPLIVGITASYGPTLVFPISRPTKVVPRIDSCTKSRFRPSLPLALSTAIRAHVPVPHA